MTPNWPTGIAGEPLHPVTQGLPHHDMYMMRGADETRHYAKETNNVRRQGKHKKHLSPPKDIALCRVERTAKPY